MAGSLVTDGCFVAYGPFRYDGEFTSPSNARFDQFLRERDPMSGIRDIEDVSAAAKEHGLELTRDVAMPANNQLLVFRHG